MNPWSDLNGAFGHPFARAAMSQSFSALYWLGRLIEEHPRLTYCLELGTLNGALSTFLGLSFPSRAVTVDIIDKRSEFTKELHARLGIRYQTVDVLQPGIAPSLLYACRGVYRVGEGPTKSILLFCDNGNKEREFLEFAPHLLPGDAVAVHDLNTEFFPGKPEVASAIELNGLTSWREEELKHDSTYLGVWVKS